MKPSLARLSVACGLMLALATGSVGAKSTRLAIAWKPSFQAALQEAKRTKKPVLVDFWWVAVKVDIDEQPEIASRYGLQSPPMVAFLKPDGTLSSRFEGCADAPALLKQMKAAHARARRR